MLKPYSNPSDADMFFTNLRHLIEYQEEMYGLIGFHLVGGRDAAGHIKMAVSVHRLFLYSH